MFVPTKGPRETILIFVGTSDARSELPTILGTFLIHPNEGPQVQNFFFVGTSDPASKLLKIHLNLYIPVG
jgi:hypothetical protein